MMPSTVSADFDYVARHPAVKAWQEVAPFPGFPQRIETLKQHSKSQVYRLVGFSRFNQAIVAKRANPEKLATERLIYEHFLPNLPCTSPEYFGSIEKGDSGWLFLADAEGTPYDYRDSGHRRAAVQWLGDLHACGAELKALALLPDRGPQFYYQHMREARAGILRLLPRLDFTSDQTVMLHAIVAQFDVVESHWEEVLRSCERVPETVVHGDFVRKNVRVKTVDGVPSIFAFDWEIAGRATPAVDLRQIDAELYLSIIKNARTDVSLQGIHDLAMFGQLLRRLVAISWATLSLEAKLSRRPIDKLNVYHCDLGSILSKLGWQP